MTVRKIHLWPDKVLSTPAKPVEQFEPGLSTLVADLFETMYSADGIGLAANQIGVLQRVLVVDLDPKNQRQTDKQWAQQLSEWNFIDKVALINPEITQAQGSIIWEEGCLSVPGFTDEVERSAQIVVSFLDTQGQQCSLQAQGLFAVAIQHEMDHLDGKVFVEYLSRLKQDVVRRKMRRLQASPSAQVEPAKGSPVLSNIR